MEKNLVETWNVTKRDQSHEFVLPIRHVLVNTGDLFQIRYISDFEDAAKEMSSMIINALGQRGYGQIQENTIKNQVYTDLLNGDVPFFTESKGIIYYGYANEGNQIGKRQ